MPDDTIIGVVLNSELIESLVATWGPNFFMIKDANSNELTPENWKAKYGTDGMGLVAIRNKRKEMMGTGVHF
jgi:hypothetical protein